MARLDTLWALIAVFVPFSFASIGGGSSIIPGIQHQAVDVYGWVSAREFVELFAIARAAPGPGSMLVTLVGWKAADWPGAISATLALYVPSSILLYGAARAWNRYRGRAWHTALEKGLAPIGAGLTGAAILSILSVIGGGWLVWAVMLGSAAALTLRPTVHPLVLFAVGAAIFIAVHAPGMG